MFRLRGFDLKEHLGGEEIQLRLQFRPVPNVMGYSLFFKSMADKRNHLSIVENTLTKASGTSWRDWLADLRDRRDMANYIRQRWIGNF